MNTNPKPKATILDVARRAGVSRTTVSRVLNEPDRVTQETLKRVQDAAEALHYSPNTIARGLRRGMTGLIALLVGDVSQPFHGSLAQAVVTAAEESGIGVMLYDLAHSVSRLETVLNKLPQQGVDGAIIATADDISTPPVHSAVDVCRAHGLAIVTGVEQPGVPGVPSVRTDLQAVTGLAVEALEAEGAENPVLLLNDRNGPIGRRLAEGGGDARVIEVGYEYERAANAVRELTSDHDAIIAGTLPTALGAMSVLAEQSRQLPVIVCEEVPFAAQVTPAFTTSAVSPELTGREMVRLLRAQIGGHAAEPILLTPVITRRDTF